MGRIMLATSNSTDEEYGGTTNAGKESLTPSFVHSTISNNSLQFYKQGDVLYIGGNFSGTDIPRYTALFTIPGITVGNTFIPIVSASRKVGYMEVYTSDGNTNLRIGNFETNISEIVVLNGTAQLVEI